MYLLVRELTGNSTGGIRRRPAVRLRAVPPAAVLAPAGAVVAVDAVRAVRDDSLLRQRDGFVRLPARRSALVLQNLSSGYYLLFFPPFAAAYVAVGSGEAPPLARSAHVAAASAAGALVAAVTAPFLLPYAAMRTLWDTLRPAAEVSRFSADVYSYATAFSEQRIWGDILRAFPKPEGRALSRARSSVLLGTRRSSRGAATVRPRTGPRHAQPGATRASLVRVAAGRRRRPARRRRPWPCSISRRIAFDLGWFELRMSNANQLLVRGDSCRRAPAAGLAARAGLGRGRSCATAASPVAGLLVAVWLSLGPLPQAQGRPVEIAAPYRLLYEHVPGFDGLRVPARFAMIEALMLAVLGGIWCRTRSAALRPGIAVLGAAGVFFFLEATQVPFTTNGMAPIRGLATPGGARLPSGPRARGLPRDGAAAAQAACSSNSRFGQPDYDLRAMFYSTVHWHALVNGYSGVFPPHYGLLTSALSEMPRHPDVSLDALRMSGATHAIVHEAAYLDTEGTRHVCAAAQRRCGRDSARWSDVLLRLPR